MKVTRRSLVTTALAARAPTSDAKGMREFADTVRDRCGHFVSVGGVPAYRGWTDPWQHDPPGLPVPVAEDADLVPDESIVVRQPDILIVDEPTAGLDPNQIRGVRRTMRRLSETKTILLSTHILQEVEAMASRVILINEGRLVYDGPLSQMDPNNKGLDKVFADLTGHGESAEHVAVSAQSPAGGETLQDSSISSDSSPASSPSEIDVNPRMSVNSTDSSRFSLASE